MNVYLVIEDNGEAYEDYNEWVDKVFLNEKNAKKYITEMKRKEKKAKRGWNGSHSWELQEHKVEDFVEVQADEC